MRTILIVFKIIVALAVFNLAVMLLWNWLAPELFKGPQINYIQSLGLLVLARILFGGFGKSFENMQHKRNRRFWKSFQEKVKNMPPEEKEKFKSDLCI